MTTPNHKPNFIKEMLILTRFEHAIMLAFAVLIGETVVLNHLPSLDLLFLLSILVPIFSEMGTFALNDYLDIESDKINKKTDRPLVRNVISPKFVLFFSIFTIALSIFLSFFINQISFWLALIFNLVAIMYNFKLKDLPLIGNIYIGLTMGIPFIFGNYVFSTNLVFLNIILAIIAFCAGLAREIIKSAQDIEGDKKARNSQTLPILIGEKNSLIIASFLYLIFIVLSFIPLNSIKLDFQNIPILLISLLLIVSNALVLSIIIKLIQTILGKNSDKERTYRYARKLSLIAFFVGLVALLFLSLI